MPTTESSHFLLYRLGNLGISDLAMVISWARVDIISGIAKGLEEIRMCSQITQTRAQAQQPTHFLEVVS